SWSYPIALIEDPIRMTDPVGLIHPPLQSPQAARRGVPSRFKRIGPAVLIVQERGYIRSKIASRICGPEIIRGLLGIPNKGIIGRVRSNLTVSRAGVDVQHESKRPLPAILHRDPRLRASGGGKEN